MRLAQSGGISSGELEIAQELEGCEALLRASWDPLQGVSSLFL